MRLRPYQLQAIDKTLEALQEHASALIVMATGLGKTVVFSELLNLRRLQAPPAMRRALVLAHRDELINQAADKIARIMGDKPDIEKAERWADDHYFGSKADVIVASVQTLRDDRLKRLDPMSFGTLVVDEAHHSVAKSYRSIIAHFQQNKDLKLVGVTATPDRADEEALGQVYQCVPFVYELPHAVADGWLVNPLQQSVIVEDLDFSQVRTTAGDLNGRDLAKLMETEANLHAIASTTIREAGGRKTLVFTASIAQAERTCEIFNRHREGCARWVHGGTPQEQRRAMLKDYAASPPKFQYLVNVGVATEGFDDPGIECIAIGRPTESRSLYCQMVGRGTRPLPGIVDADPPHETTQARRDAIAASSKRDLLVLDFEGNAGRHKLVSVIDIMAGKFSEEAAELVARQQRKAANGAPPLDTLKALNDAEAKIAERRKREAEKARAGIVASVTYKLKSIDPFDVFDIAPPRSRGWDKARPPTPRMVEVLQKHGIDVGGRNFAECGMLIEQIIERSKKRLCTFKQAKFLRGYGVDTTDLTFGQASAKIDQIAANGGRMTYTPRNESQAVAA